MKIVSKKDLERTKARGGVVKGDTPKPRPKVTRQPTPEVKPPPPLPRDPAPDVERVLSTVAQTNREATSRFEVLMEQLIQSLRDKPDNVSPGEVKRLHIRRNQRGLIESIDVERG